LPKTAALKIGSFDNEDKKLYLFCNSLIPFCEPFWKRNSHKALCCFHFPSFKGIVTIVFPRRMSQSTLRGSLGMQESKDQERRWNSWVLGGDEKEELVQLFKQVDSDHDGFLKGIHISSKRSHADPNDLVFGLRKSCLDHFLMVYFQENRPGPSLEVLDYHLKYLEKYGEQ
jgi:hypothetical protein